MVPIRFEGRDVQEQPRYAASRERSVIPRNMKCADRTHPSHASRNEENRLKRLHAHKLSDENKKKKTPREDESSCIAGVLEMAVCRLRLLATNQVFHLLLSCTPSPQFPLDYSGSQIFPPDRHNVSKKMLLLSRTHHTCALNGTLVVKESFKYINSYT